MDENTDKCQDDVAFMLQCTLFKARRVTNEQRQNASNYSLKSG